jgi:hypothetical protein
MVQYIVVLSSLISTEPFQYDSAEEQKAGAARLIESAKIHTSQDRILRSVGLIPEPWNGETTLEEFIEWYGF